MIGGREIAAGDLAALRLRHAKHKLPPRLGFLGREFGAHLGAAGRAA